MVLAYACDLLYLWQWWKLHSQMSTDSWGWGYPLALTHRPFTQLGTGNTPRTLPPGTLLSLGLLCSPRNPLAAAPQFSEHWKSLHASRDRAHWQKEEHVDFPNADCTGSVGKFCYMQRVGGGWLSSIGLRAKSMWNSTADGVSSGEGPSSVFR